MTKQDVFIPSVNAGEFSPKLESRIDFNKYPNGAKRLKNYNLLPHGGFYRRPGFKRVVDTKSDGQARLLPFIFNETDATGIEAGTNYFRFLRKQAQLTVADTDAAVANGLFAVDITGWGDISTGSAAITHDAANERMQLTGAAGAIAWAEDSIAVTDPTIVISLQFTVAGTAGLTCLFQVGSSSGASDIAFENGSTQLRLGIGTHVITFTPGSGNDPFYIQFGNDNNILDTAENIFIDNVIILDNAALELVSPYTAAQMQNVQYVQAGDIIYLAHTAVHPRRLERRGTNTWSCVEVFFEDGPWNAINEGFDIKARQLVDNPVFNTGITPWANTSAINANSPQMTYDGEQQFVTLSGGNIARITSTITSGYRGGVSTWYTLHYLTVGGGQANTNEFGTRVVVGTTSGAVDILEVNSQGVPAGWDTADFQTSASSPFYLTFSYQSTIQSGGAGGAFIYPQDARLMDVTGQTGSITVTARAGTIFDTTNDVGRYIRFEYPGYEAGWGVITAVASTTSATVQVRRKIPHQKHTESWRLGAWSATTGYPERVSFFEGRAVWANNTANPRGVWLSQSADIENMQPDSFVAGGNTVEDDDALDFTLSSPEADDIQWLTSQQKLVLGAIGGPWVGSSTGSVMTPSDRTFVPQTATKTSDIQPLLVGNAVLFPSLSKRKLYELQFRFETDQFVATDLTQLADHVTDIQMTRLAFQQDPNPVVWMHRDVDNNNDGRLHALAYNRAEDIIGWTRMEMGGSWGGGRLGSPAVESVITIPGDNDSTQDYNSGNRDEVWVITKRTVNGSTVRFIEFLERDYEAPKREDYSTEAKWVSAVQEDQAEAFYVDGGITFKATALTITAITKANPAVVSASNSLSNGNEVRLEGVLGMTEVNGRKFTVANVSGTTFELASEDSSAYTAYVSGGKARQTSTSVTGLTHLEAESVYALADGVVQGPFTVSSGTITLSDAAAVVQVGLQYTSEFESLKMPYGSQRGTGIGKQKTLSGLTLALLDTATISAGVVEYDTTSGRTTNTNEAISRSKSSIVTLDSFEYNLKPQHGITKDVRVWTTDSNPLPHTVLGIGAYVDTSDGEFGDP